MATDIPNNGRRPLAYKNEEFLDSWDGRSLRILSEYLEPLTHFRDERVRDTIVFFGSARIREDGPGARYYQEARELARRLAEAAGAELIGVTVGGKGVGVAIASKAALSRGLDRVVIIEDEALREAGRSELGAVLAAAKRNPGLSWMKGDPLLKSLEGDPRYAAFLKKIRLPA